MEFPLFRHPFLFVYISQLLFWSYIHVLYVHMKICFEVHIKLQHMVSFLCMSPSADREPSVWAQLHAKPARSSGAAIVGAIPCAAPDPNARILFHLQPASGIEHRDQCRQRRPVMHVQRTGLAAASPSAVCSHGSGLWGHRGKWHQQRH